MRTCVVADQNCARKVAAPSSSCPSFHAAVSRSAAVSAASLRPAPSSPRASGHPACAYTPRAVGTRVRHRTCIFMYIKVCRMHTRDARPLRTNEDSAERHSHKRKRGGDAQLVKI